MLIALAHVALATALFFMTNWLGRHSSLFGYKSLSMFSERDSAPAFNFVFRVLTPVAFMTIAAAVLYALSLDALVADIYRVVIYSFILRAVFNIATGRGRLVNWTAQSAHFLSSAALSWLAYDHVISSRESLLPDAGTMSGEMWLGVAAFLYAVANSIQVPVGQTEQRKENYLRSRLSIYTREYGDIVDSLVSNDALKALIYAVMIFEAFNRPKVYRVLEIPLFFLGYAKTLGIMQVTSDRYISDRESVKLGVLEIIRAHKLAVSDASLENHGPAPQLGPADRIEGWATLRRERSILQTIIKEYNGSRLYETEVTRLYERIKELWFGASINHLSDPPRQAPNNNEGISRTGSTGS